MKLGYRIVWVDDSPDWVHSVEGEITAHLEEMGYEPKIDILEGGDNLKQQCAGADIDLIIIDYNLQGENGDVLISKLREWGHFTEIVFYSEGPLPKKDIRAMDGVFCCQRPDAQERIKRVVDLTLHKLKDLGVIRGLVISEAIDLEVRIEELIVLWFGDKGTVFQNRVLDETWFDFGKKSSFLQGIVKDRVHECEVGEQKEKLKAAKKTLNEFDEEVVDHRNILAHSRRTEKDGKIVLEGINKRTEEISFDDEWLATMRANLRKHQENLDALEKLLRDGTE